MLNFCAVALLLAGCGGVNEKEVSDSFSRYCENFLLRLQKQYYDPQTAPADVTINIAAKREVTFRKPATPQDRSGGTLVFYQTEESQGVTRERTVTVRFVYGNGRWDVAEMKAQITEIRKASRGKILAEPGPLEQVDPRMDEVLGPRLRAALESTPQY
jgi:hypothetical protein